MEVSSQYQYIQRSELRPRYVGTEMNTTAAMKSETVDRDQTLFLCFSTSVLPVIRPRHRCSTSCRNSVRVVWILLPGEGAVRVDVDVLVLNHLPSLEVNGNAPERVTRRVLRRAKRNAVAGVPVPESINVAHDLDGLAPCRGH
jgi:hypothetical protein